MSSMSTRDSQGTDQRVCKWTEDDCGIWDTECNEKHVLIEGSPADNHMRFCCYCGGKLAQCSYQEALDNG